MTDKSEIQPKILLKDNSSKWKSMKVRAVTGFSLMGAFFACIAMGHIAILFLILLMQFLAFHELLSLPALQNGISERDKNKLSLFKYIPWVYLIIAMYATNGGALLYLFSNRLYLPNLPYSQVIWDLVRYHKLVTFGLYSFAVVGFVLTLQRGLYQYQFRRWSIAVLGLIVLVVQSHVMIYNLFEGIFWFFFPLSLIVVNDTSAYFWGFFFGSHSLIQLSPKKTWEGFIGAIFTTALWAWTVSPLFSRFPFFICPATTSSELFGWLAWEEHHACMPGPNDEVNPFFETQHVLANTLWTPTDFPLPLFLVPFFGQFLTVYPIQLHALILSIVASTIAPFGGFFASGFKRAFKIKDFGSLLPGHGGFIDRLDCQFIMAFFVYIYIDTVLNKNAGSDLTRAWSIIQNLTPHDQNTLLQHLQYSLKE